jgi:cytochrome P450
LARLFQRADFKLATDVPIMPEDSATLRPRGGVPMNIRLRSRQAREALQPLSS